MVAWAQVKSTLMQPFVLAQEGLWTQVRAVPHSPPRRDRDGIASISENHLLAETHGCTGRPGAAAAHSAAGAQYFLLLHRGGPHPFVW